MPHQAEVGNHRPSDEGIVLLTKRATKQLFKKDRANCCCGVRAAQAAANLWTLMDFAHSRGVPRRTLFQRLCICKCKTGDFEVGLADEEALERFQLFSQRWALPRHRGEKHAVPGSQGWEQGYIKSSRWRANPRRHLFARPLLESSNICVRGFGPPRGKILWPYMLTTHA